MQKYDYMETLKQDIKQYIIDEGAVQISDYEDKEDLENAIFEEAWVMDSITGNASGSYFFDAWKAEEAICHNMDLAQEAFENFGYEGVDFSKGAEYIDVTIRCYLLMQAIDEVLDEMEEENE